MGPKRNDSGSDPADVVKRLYLLLEISRDIGREISLKELLTTLTEKTAAALSSERGAVFLYDEGTDELWSIVAMGELGEIRFPADRGIAGWVFRNRRSLVVPDAYADARFNPDVDKKTGYRTRNMICSPIMDAGEECIGALELLNKTAAGYGPDDLEFLEALSGHAAVAIKNARLFEERARMFDSLIDVLGESIESRDPYTAGHSREVMEYSVGIAEELGLDEAQKEVIRYAALLHDYGKIGIPDNILRKRDVLTDEEYEIIKNHVVYTREILGKIAFEKKLRSVPAVAGSHHERLSGSGYPGALRGREIPLGGRVISVADTFQALTSDRPYHRAISAAEALAMLDRDMDVEYDGEVVRALRRYLVKRGLLPE